jgi:hypothetical protein
MHIRVRNVHCELQVDDRQTGLVAGEGFLSAPNDGIVIRHETGAEQIWIALLVLQHDISHERANIALGIAGAGMLLVDNLPTRRNILKMRCF